MLVCYRREDLVAANWNKRRATTTAMYVSSVASMSWSEEYKSLEWHCDEVLVCGGFFMWPLKDCLHGNGLLLDSMPSSSNKRWGITIFLTFWISRHIRSAAHTVSIPVRNMQQWPQFCIDKTLFQYETLIKGRAIRTQGSLEYQTVKLIFKPDRTLNS